MIDRRLFAPFVTAFAVAVTTLAVIFSGAATPLELLDPGPAARWGLPITRTVHDLAAALTVGALLVGGLLVPESSTSQRRRRTASIAAWSALAWALAGAVHAVLAYAAAAGVPVGAPGFWTGAWKFTWDLEVLRAPAITAVGAAIVSAWCFLGPRRDGQAWAFFGSLLALWPLALAGHAAGSPDHETAVDSLAVHLISVAIWVGGLATICLLWTSLGKAAAVVLQRFSKIAIWCYVAVAGSGVLAALLRIGSPGDLFSKYGTLLLLKAAVLVVLGLLGDRQRRKVIAALAEDPKDAPAKSLAVRLASVEVLLMGVAIGLATALARTAPPVVDEESTDPVTALTGYPAPPPISVSEIFFSWRTQWLFTTAALVAIGVYLAWVRRLHRRGDRWPIGRTISWCSGWLLFIFIVDGGPGVYGRVMFSAHMAEHMMLAMVIPILLVRGAGVTLALRALPKRQDKTLGPRELLLASVHSKVMTVVANPAIIATIVLGTLVMFYFTRWFEFALTTHTGHLTMVIHFMLSGYLFAWALVGIDPGPRKWPAPVRMLVLLVTVAFHAFFGVALMTGTQLLGGEFFNRIQLPYVPDLLMDQQRAGTVAWGVGEVPALALTMLIAYEWYRTDNRDAKRHERQAERDGDAELNAYNDYLAGLRGGRKEQS
ncbi:bifunctional copper resistance protein CopD/cytochrome c oxidase assembly protein [Yimella sp. cx-573]|nr:bifunctional copper resistance protein CopD/cytochrome c oxidase assembly protein [Yimella sp. cx-573]